MSDTHDGPNTDPTPGPSRRSWGPVRGVVIGHDPDTGQVVAVTTERAIPTPAPTEPEPA